jgi:predicted TIM-barrel fold metal-dependent hydrolase
MKKSTVFGELEIFDAHTHFFSRSFFAALARQSPLLKGLDDPLKEIGEMTGMEMPPETAGEFARKWCQELDKYSVAKALLMASLPGDEESVATAVRLFPERFSGAFFFDPRIENAEEEAVKIFDELGFSVICLFPAMHHYSVADNETVKAIAGVVSERPGTAIFVHCGALSVGIRGKLGMPSKFDLRFSNPLDVHKLASEIPGANFIIPHFGAGFWREALMAADLSSNIYLDTSSSNKWTKYQAGDIGLRKVFERTIDVVGPERLLFGTDSSVFPRGWNSAVFDEQMEVLESIGVDSEIAAAIFGGNLCRLLKG